MRIGDKHRVRFAGERNCWPKRWIGGAVATLETTVAYFAQHGNRMEEAECRQPLGELDARLGDAANAYEQGRLLELWQSFEGADEHVATVSSAVAAL